MLDTILKFVVDELNSYLKAKTGVTDNVVKLGQVIDDNGKYALAKESVVMTLINLEQETVTCQQLPVSKFVDGQTILLPPELKLNLSVMFVARFSVYDQALKYLSHIMNFFQVQPAFSAESHPALEEPAERITLELQSLSYDQLNQVWAFMGGKHLPSVIYKMRGIRLQDHDAPEFAPPVLEVKTKINSN